MSDRRRYIHVPGYDGEERRNGGGQRASDKIAGNLKLIAVALGIAISIFSFGGGWVATRGLIDSKVSQKDFDAKNADQDRRSQIIENRQDRYEDVMIKQVLPALAEIKSRVSAIYCDKKPPGCQ